MPAPNPSLRHLAPLAAALALALAACGDDAKTATDTTVAPDVADTAVAPDTVAPDADDTAVAPDTTVAPDSDTAPDVADAADTVDAPDVAPAAAAITALRVEPAVLHPSSPLSLVFAAAGASTCTLEAPVFDAPRSAGAAAIAAGHLDFTLTQAEVDAHGTGWTKLTLRCAAAASGGAEAVAAIYVPVALGPAIAITVTPAVLPAEGGSVDICWDASNAAFCAVFAPGFAQEELGASGCVEDVPMSADAVSQVNVQCGDGLVDGTGNVVAEPALVVAGAGVRAFAANPQILGQPGPTHVTWEAGGVDTCKVTIGDRVVAVGAEGAVDVPVAAETELVLRCAAGDRVFEERRTVSVGAAILGAAFQFEGDNLFTWQVLADTCSIDVHNDTFSFHRDGLATTGKGTALPLPIPTDTRAAGVTVTLTCTAEDGRYTATRVVTIPSRPTITSVTFDPPGLPPGGGLVTACWDAERADVCEVYMNGSGDMVSTYATTDCMTYSATDWFHFRLECYGDPIEPAVYETELPIGRWVGLTAEPPVLASAGTATLTWKSAGLDGCALLANGAFVAAVAASGSREVAVTDDTDFLVRCAGDGAIWDSQASVRVGAGIDAFDAVATAQGARLSWATSLVDGCDLTVATTAETYTVSGVPPAQEASAGPVGPRPPKGGSGGLVAPFDRALDATLTLTCHGPAGTSTRSVEVPAALPVAITSMTVTPERLPPGGADLDVCITTTGVDICTVGFISLETGIGRAIAFPAGVPTEFTSGNGCLSRSTSVGLFFDETTQVYVHCVGVLGDVDRTVVVGAGPAVTALTVEPPQLAQPGTVAVSWTSVLAVACELRRDGVVVADGTSGEAVPVALDATSVLEVTCHDDTGDSRARSVTVPVGSEVAVEAHPNGSGQIVAHIATSGVTACRIVADNGTYSVGSGVAYAREDAPLNGDYYLDWWFPELGAASVEVTCTDASGGEHRATTTVAPPEAPVITMFDAPEGLDAPGVADVCFASTGATYCELALGDLGVATFPSGEGCWSDEGRGPASFTAPTWVNLNCYGLYGVSASRFQSILVGPTIRDFTVDTTLVPDGGEVHLTWSTFAMKSCDVLAGADLVSKEASGELTLSPTANETLLLSCTGVDGETYEREVALEVGRQIARFHPYAFDASTVVVEWRALFVDDCSVDVATAGGDPRAHLTDQPAEGGVGIPWDFAADGPAEVVLRCHAAGASTLVAEQRVGAPEAVHIDAFEPTRTALAASGSVDVCWAVSGSVNACVLELTATDPLRASSPYASIFVPTAGCASDSGLSYPATADGLPIAESSVVSLTCWGPVDVKRIARTVTVGPDIGDLYAEPSSLAAPGTTTLHWTTGGLGGCALTNPAGDILATAPSGDLTVALQTSTLFTLRCAGPDGDLVRRLGVGVGPSAFIELARPIDPNTSVVSWRGEGAVGCTLTLTGSAWSQSFDLWPTGTLTFYTPFAEQGDVDLDLVCHGTGDAAASAYIPSPLPRILRFDATPTALSAPGTVNVCWDVTEVDGCDLLVDGVAGFTHPAKDCLDVALDAPATLTLSCPGPIGTATRDLPIALGPTILDLSADFTRLPPGGYFTTVTWSSVLTTGCTLSDGQGVIGTGASGSVRPFVAVDTTFTLTCGEGQDALVRTLDVKVE